ncbi:MULTISPECIES: hypothetical protein [Gammaproteobacteria]|uniref:hypothetical protein n=1 Tax=Gammaproteobacteria TaxID=1236 RepID=UPI000D5860F9|nr:MULTISPECIES: hypothetical protein [Gammaproteobacteria]EAB9607595.1 hypothetical protein [Salmonella enterica subsp. enterica serovar Infantis]ECU8224422.1 hypothetical protein [Salmonella enterica subsp. enterica serovar Thompson]EFB1674991.1 hypothetical protein [Escherichia coli]EFF6325551.1 hypothetical protein [Escherichia coli]EGK3609061.1 hypothetical protein [Escherichia coli]
MSLKIKDYGRDRKFRSVDELQSTLSEQYKGRHVSIVYPTNPNGLLRTVFVSVDSAGGINETYGNQSPVDFNAIKDDLSGEAL